MGQFEQIQTRKAISAYGGVGSILETRDGSIIISPFNEWPFFQVVNSNFEDHNIINDKRFKNRLSKYFQELESLIRIPVNDLQQGYNPVNKFAFLSAKYFPEWFYCNACHKFDKLSNWKQYWDISVKPKLPKDKNGNDNEYYFFPPRCYSCYLKNEKKNKKYFILEQVRFILTAPNGDIADIPWDNWALFKSKLIQRKQNENSNHKDAIDKNEEPIVFENINFPENYRLSLSTSEKIDDLSGMGIKITDANIKNTKLNQVNYVTLSGLFNIRFKKKDLFVNVKPEETDILFKPVIRSSNSVYYPNILSSIFIPANDELNEFTINIIKEECEDGNNATQISKNLKRYKKIEIGANSIQDLIDNNFSERETEIAKTENQYRFDEYNFIIDNDSCIRREELIFNKIDEHFFQNELIESIYKMDKIKITSVQPSYTRQEPISMDSFLMDGNNEALNTESIKKKFTSLAGKNTSYLPAIESYGEGIFFDFNNNKLDSWVNSHTDIEKRISTIIDNHDNRESDFNDGLELTPKFILIHTFSHLIIKELEYLCGYPATSIQERLYIDDELKMNGVLIYTIAGSEGSYGGLTSICDNDKIGKLIESAMIRAKDCATDPICYHTNGQGVSNLNLSACFSCTLLPETSCEMFNCYLDRRILIDKYYGYFKNI